MVSWAAPTLRRTTFFFFWNHFERTPAEFERTKKYAEYAGGEALVPTSRTNPRSLVFGHLLEETPDELYVYDTISHDETKVQFSKLLRSGAGLFTVDQRTVELCLMDGGLSIRFSEELLTHVCACIDEEHVHPEQKNVSSEDEDSTDEEVAKEHDLGHESVPA